MCSVICLVLYWNSYNIPFALQMYMADSNQFIIVQRNRLSLIMLLVALFSAYVFVCPHIWILGEGFGSSMFSV